MADLKYISDFLSKVEGKRQTRGYVPCVKVDGGTANYTGIGNPEGYRAMGASGVTIATGCDLGQRKPQEMATWGLDMGIIGCLASYFGLKRMDALHWLHKYPLVVSPEAAAAIDTAVHAGYLNRYVRPAWEKASGLVFDEQPKQAQAVIMSACFQKGCAGVAKEWPRLWRHLCAADWRAAADELLHGFTQYKSRRATEGRLLMETCQ